MSKILNFLQKVLKPSKYRYISPEEQYLSQSTDLADLERRTKEIQNPGLGFGPTYKFRYWV